MQPKPCMKLPLTHCFSPLCRALPTPSGIGKIAAVSGVRQSYYSEDDATAFKEAYDDFFTELGIPKSAAGFFRVPLPLQEKPLTFIKHGHKIRTREKRAFKQQIQLACAGFFEKFAPDASHKLPA